MIALLIPPQLALRTDTYQLGDISRDNIRAPQDFSSRGCAVHGQIKQEKQAAVLSVYDFNSKADEDIDKRVTTAFSVLREAVKRVKKHDLLRETWNMSSRKSCASR